MPIFRVRSFAMVRRMLLISLALTAISVAGAGIRSYFVPLSLEISVSDHDGLIVHFFDGRARLFWCHSEKAAISVTRLEGRPEIRIGPKVPGSSTPSGRGRSWAVAIPIGNRRAVGPFGYAWRSTTWGRAVPVVVSFVRVPVWLPTVLLIVAPTIAVIRGPMTQRRRRKRNQCIACGYDLTGNISGRCSECGAPIDASRYGDGST